jgi:hypothetical protein
VDHEDPSFAETATLPGSRCTATGGREARVEAGVVGRYAPAAVRAMAFTTERRPLCS